MEPANLLVICGVAFVAVFTLLSALAVLMALVTRLLPEPEALLDAALVAAVSSAVAAAHPGARLIRIEEER